MNCSGNNNIYQKVWSAALEEDETLQRSNLLYGSVQRARIDLVSDMESYIKLFKGPGVLFNATATFKPF